MTSISGLLVLAAFGLTIVHAGWGRVQLWVPVLLLTIALLLGYLPLR